MIEISSSNAGDACSVSGWGEMGAKISHVSRSKKPKQNRSHIIANSIKTLEMIHIQKIKKTLPSQRGLLGMPSFKVLPIARLLSPFLALFSLQHFLTSGLFYIFLIFVNCFLCLEPGQRHCTARRGTLSIACNAEYDVAAVPEIVPGI